MNKGFNLIYNDIKFGMNLNNLKENSYLNKVYF